MNMSVHTLTPTMLTKLFLLQYSETTQEVGSFSEETHFHYGIYGRPQSSQTPRARLDWVDSDCFLLLLLLMNGFTLFFFFLLSFFEGLDFFGGWTGSRISSMPSPFFTCTGSSCRDPRVDQTDVVEIEDSEMRLLSRRKSVPTLRYLSYSLVN